MQEWTFVDKKGWPDGPWHIEPDKVQWVDPETGLDCLIHRNQFGALCGYVGVPPGHKYHGLGYDSVDVDAHGGLTFAAFCAENTEECGRGICHIPEEGRPDQVWWLGFDCAHAWDYVPGMPMSAIFSSSEAVYRDIGYVKREVRALAKQLSEVGKQEEEQHEMSTRRSSGSN